MDLGKKKAVPNFKQKNKVADPQTPVDDENETQLIRKAYQECVDFVKQTANNMIKDLKWLGDSGKLRQKSNQYLQNSHKDDLDSDKETSQTENQNKFSHKQKHNDNRKNHTSFNSQMMKNQQFVESDFREIIAKRQKDESYQEQDNKRARNRVSDYQPRLDKRATNPQRLSNQTKPAQTTEFKKCFAGQRGNSKQLEKLPCSFCSKLVTFQELDRHHNRCRQAFKCQFCLDFYPITHVNEHKSLCRRKVKEQKQNQIKQPQYFKDRQRNPTRDKQPEPSFQEQMEFIQLCSLHPDIQPDVLKEHLEVEKIKKNYRQRQSKRNAQKYDLERKEKQEFNNYKNYERGFGSFDYSYMPTPFYQKKAKVVEGLKKHEIQKYATGFYVKGQTTEEDQCSICTKQKQEGQRIIRLPCFHTYHQVCILPWLDVKSVCPDCKFDLKLK